MTVKVGVVIDPWDYPYNGTVVSTRRFVSALSGQVDFRLLATPHPDLQPDARLRSFPKLSIPGFNGIIEGMKVPLANPWFNAKTLEDALTGLDVLHVQFPFFLGYKACNAAKRMNVPLICSFHVQPENLLRNLGISSDWLSKRLYALFIKTIYSKADLVLAPSEFAKQQLINNGHKGSIEVLSNGVPPEFFKLHRSDFESGFFELLSVGRMAPEKHQGTILEALAKSKFKDQIRLTMIGTGPMEDTLRKSARELGVNAKIGPVDNDALKVAYSSADLFIHAGEIELEGMSVLEAMAAGNAVLVSDSENSATGEFVHEAQSRFRHGDVEDLVQKIDYWLESENLRTEAGTKNQLSAKGRHHQASIDQLYSIYQQYTSC